MNELQEILVVVFVCYVVVKGTLLWLVHKKMLEIGEQARMRRMEKRAQESAFIPDGWTENEVIKWG